jgi:hypothetical protein
LIFKGFFILCGLAHARKSPAPASQDVSGSFVTANASSDGWVCLSLYVPKGVTAAHTNFGVISGVKPLDNSRLPQKMSSKFAKSSARRTNTGFPREVLTPHGLETVLRSSTPSPYTGHVIEIERLRLYRIPI